MCTVCRTFIVLVVSIVHCLLVLATEKFRFELHIKDYSKQELFMTYANGMEIIVMFGFKCMFES